MKVYVVQERIFGDYGNGEVYGVFTDQDAANRLADEKNGAHTDVIEAELSRTAAELGQEYLDRKAII